ncbi:MAG: hypothetical protein H7Y17_10175, partial [Chlorobia bacterium]|nr:hypothetical protein [Fimbriimonadaceae bacterium]
MKQRNLTFSFGLLSLSLTWLSFAVGSSSGVAIAQDPPLDQVAFFEAKIRPVLADNCYSCHGPKVQMAGLRLDSNAGVLKGADSGKVIVSGDPE